MYKGIVVGRTKKKMYDSKLIIYYKVKFDVPGDGQYTLYYRYFYVKAAREDLDEPKL